MEQNYDLETFKAALTRWHEGCVFYFKLDLAVIAAIAAIVSYLKLNNDQVLLAVHEQRSVVFWLLGLVVYALLFEVSLTHVANRLDLAAKVSDLTWQKVMHIALRYAYALQVFAHIMFFVGIASFLLGYADGFASHGSAK